MGDFVSTKKKPSDDYKIVILDESDSMTKDAQFALRCIIEKYAVNARFCLICNSISSLIPALHSRCAHFRFAPLPESLIKKKIKQIISQESLFASEDGIETIIKLGKGDMRSTINILQSTSMAFSNITEDTVYNFTGNPHPRDIETIVHWLLTESFHTCIRNITEITIYILKIKMTKHMKIDILIALAELEQRLALGANEKIQLASLVGSFILAKIT